MGASHKQITMFSMLYAVTDGRIFKNSLKALVLAFLSTTKNSSKLGMGKDDGSGELNTLLEAKSISCGREELGEEFLLLGDCSFEFLVWLFILNHWNIKIERNLAERLEMN